jgi:carbonic anhydrase
MKRILKSLLISSIFGLSPMVIASEVNIHWGYDKDSAPEHWGSLSEQFKICNTGKNQSPINITNAFSVVEKRILIFHIRLHHKILYLMDILFR